MVFLAGFLSGFTVIIFYLIGEGFYESARIKRRRQNGEKL